MLEYVILKDIFVWAVCLLDWGPYGTTFISLIVHD